MDVSKHTANGDLADFLDRLIHDMREPLRSIGAFTEILKETTGTEGNPESQQALGQIHAGAAGITRLVEGLSGYAVALREPAETDTPASMQSAFIIVTGELDDGIRSSAATVTAVDLPKVGVSFDRVIQLLRILIGNALRFRTEAAPVIRLSAAREEPGMWAIRVEDNGIGIAGEDRDAVFRPFMRVHGRKYGGVGLGLTIAKQIVEAHGGTIRMEPPAERGTVCVFTLPEI
jgi:signal transduction histidine kinase